MCKLTSCVGALILGLGWSVCCSAQTDANLLKSLKSSLPPKIINPGFTVHVKVKEETERSDYFVELNYSKELLAAKKAAGKSFSKEVAEYEILVHGPDYLARIQSAKSVGRKQRKIDITSVLAINPLYGFKITQQEGRTSLLELVERNSEFARTPRFTKMIRSTLGTVSSQEIYDLGLFSEYLNSDVLKIRKIEQQENLLRAELESAGQENPHLMRFRDAYSIHDSKLNLAIVEFGCVVVGPKGQDIATIHNTYSYQPTASGEPIVKVMNCSHRFASEPEGSESTFQRTIEILRENVPEQEFLLSHYGLSEPRFDFSWLKYVLIGASLTAVGFVLNYWKRARTA